MIVLKKIQLLFDRDSFFSLGNSFFHKGDRRKKIPGKIFLLLAGIVVYFIVLQLCLRHYEPGIERDSVAILNQTAAWHRTGVYVAEDQTGKFVPPLALYIFRLPLVLNLPLESGILFLILLFGTSVPVLSFLIAREWCLDDKVSLVFAALMASNPYLHDIYNAILRDPVFIPLALSSCYLILRNYNRPGIFPACAAGFVSALAFITRYEGILFPVIFAGFTVSAALRDRTWTKSLVMMFLFSAFWVAGVFLPLYFWGIYPIARRVYFWRFSTLLH